MTSPLPLLLPWLRSEIRHENASLAACFLEGFPCLGSQHSIMRILQSLQYSPRDLPVGSFAEAGTNVPTGLLKMRAAA